VKPDALDDRVDRYARAGRFRLVKAGDRWGAVERQEGDIFRNAITGLIEKLAMPTVNPITTSGRCS